MQKLSKSKKDKERREQKEKKNKRTSIIRFGMTDIRFTEIQRNVFELIVMKRKSGNQIFIFKGSFIEVFQEANRKWGE